MNSISIVTICFNNLAELIQTCNSVDEQKVKPFQHIIIDGSTNLEIKEYLQNCISPAYRESVSERDKGISDAFNKGVLKARGQIVVILNSGDRLYDDSILEIVSSTFSNQPGIKWLHGKTNLTGETN